MIPISVVCPVRDGLEHVKLLVASLNRQVPASFQGAALPDAWHHLHFLDDDSRAPTRRWLDRLAVKDPRVLVEGTAGLTIYEAWNRGFWQARHQWQGSSLSARAGARWHVLVVNSDVQLPPHALASMSAALDADSTAMAAYPDFDAKWSDAPGEVALAPKVAETQGVWGSGGMLGFCFMLAGNRINWRPLIDDLHYRWWYGDNHLARAIEEAGGKQLKVLGLPVRHAHEGTARHYDLTKEKVADREWWERTAQLHGRRAPAGGARGHRVVTRRDWRRTI